MTLGLGKTASERFSFVLGGKALKCDGVSEVGVVVVSEAVWARFARSVFI